MAAFLDRLLELQGDLSDAEFARRCDIKYTTMKNYIVGRSHPPLDVAAQIANRHGKSIDWLYGNEPAQLRTEYLREVLMIVEQWLDDHERVMDPARKAEVVTRLYEFVVDDAGKGRGPDVERMHGILRLVA